MSQPFYKIGLTALFIAIVAFLVLFIFKPQVQLENSTWRNSEIQTYVIEFKNDNVFIEYNPTDSFTGTWSYHAPDLTVQLEDVTYRYTVVTLNQKELVLTISGSAEKLSFTRITR